MKKWELFIARSFTHKNFLGKIKEESVPCLWSCEAETEEEAIEKCKEAFSGTNIRIKQITDWSSWTVKKAMEKLKGEEFAEWAKQNGLTSLFN